MPPQGALNEKESVIINPKTGQGFVKVGKGISKAGKPTRRIALVLNGQVSPLGIGSENGLGRIVLEIKPAHQTWLVNLASMANARAIKSSMEAFYSMLDLPDCPFPRPSKGSGAVTWED